MVAVDGVDKCHRAVRLQIRSGARVIKICATGGVMSVFDDPDHQSFRPPRSKRLLTKRRGQIESLQRIAMAREAL